MSAGPTVEFLGGVAEIGGNKIVVEEGGDRVLFDFGPSFSARREEFYHDFLQPRSTSPVKDLLEFDLIPRVEGLYSEEALAGADLRYAAPRFGGVFVSHAHFDHAGYLAYIDPRIPVYLSAGTRQLMAAIEASTQTRYGEHDYRIVPDRQAVTVGGLEVVPVPVDHSIPWAAGFIVHAPNGTLVYTGDFRRHGPRAALTDAFVARAAEERPDALLIEGTRAGPDPRRNLSEAGVRAAVDHLLERTPDLAIASAYPRDLDRLTTLHRAAVEAGRELIVSMKTAHLLETLAGVPGGPADLPVPGTTPGLRVYARPKKVYRKWETALLDEAVDAEWVRRHGPTSLLSLDLMNFQELIDLRPPRESPYIHSMSEPFSEDDVDDAVLKNWLAHFGLSYHQMHASGHCAMGELEDVIRTVAPRTVYPIHTEHPEAFTSAGSRVVAPRLRQPYRLRP
ncbi:MAG TPA: MBL fold metallo-hydrolase [Thermoplasmata archaeon]|nr:MBL fold metallo-hydrolase [Thermoplasmata archaeon]